MTKRELQQLGRGSELEGETGCPDKSVVGRRSVNRRLVREAEGHGLSGSDRASLPFSGLMKSVRMNVNTVTMELTEVRGE